MAKYNLDLEVDAADTAVSFDVPKALAPYAREFYDVRKEEGETFEKFMCRHVCEAAVHWKAAVQLQRLTKENNDASTIDSGDLAEQASTLLAE